MPAQDALHPTLFGKRQPAAREVETPETRIRDLTATAPLMVRAPVHGVEGIAASGHFKTQHQTGTSQGRLDPAYRAEHEAKAFGPGKNPVYGYFSHGEAKDQLEASHLQPPRRRYDSVSQYGNTAFELHESVRSRSTYTIGDSLGMKSPQFTKPGVAAPSIGENDYGMKPSNLYTEAQIHGGISTHDVKRAIHYSDVDEEAGRSKIEHDETHRVTSALRSAGISHEVRRVGVGGQKVLPLSFEQWGDAVWKNKVVDPPRDVQEPTSETVSKWHNPHKQGRLPL